MNGSLRSWRPNGLLLQLAAVVLAAASLSVLIVYSLGMIGSRAHDTRDLAAAQSSTAIVIESSAHVRRVATSAQPLALKPLAEVPAEQSLVIALSAAGEIAVTLQQIEDTSASLQDLLSRDEATKVALAASEARAAFDVYLSEPNAGNYRAFQEKTQAVRDQSGGLLPVISDALLDQESSIVTITIWARNATLVVTFLAASMVMSIMWLVGQRLHRALEQAQEEKAALTESSALMRRRNEQFKALYHVVSEVSETLSLKYVVQTTIREARTLVRADVAVLRLLRGDTLTVAGTAQDVDGDVASLSDVALGVGIVGRAAKRGKIIRIDEDAEAGMAPPEHLLGIQSGVVVPLIVGARVVGSLACWSRQPFLFTSDDEQILEMMASQVATAVVAASTHEASEHEASHDALTGIPNRRQLNRDILDRFLPALAQGRAVSFTMIDIDHFKRFNDEFGHKTGDVTLQKVASVLQSTVREGDFVYRYGGEEFTIVFQDTSPEEALVVMDRVRIAVSRAPLTGSEGEPVGPVTISAGIAGGSELGMDCEAILKCADDALYQAKWSGRNRVSLYDSTIHELPSLAA